MSEKITVEIDKDVFEFLKQTAEELSKQNNRATQDPAFIITDEVKEICSYYDDYDVCERNEDRL